MASLSLYHQFETNLISNRKVIELLLQLKSAKDHGKNYIKVKPHLVRDLLRNCLLKHSQKPTFCTFDILAAGIFIQHRTGVLQVRYRFQTT